MKTLDCVDHNKLWKFLQERGVLDHLTCLLRNLYSSQEATVRTRRGTTDWFKIGKGVQQHYILSPYSFNLCAECVFACWVSHFSGVWLCAALSLKSTRLICPWDSPGSTGIGCHFLLQCIFPTQGSNLSLLHLPALAGKFFTTSATWEAPICRKHYVKCQAGWITNWNQGCWEKYQFQPQICRWCLSNDSSWKGTIELDMGQKGSEKAGLKLNIERLRRPWHPVSSLYGQ